MIKYSSITDQDGTNLWASLAALCSRKLRIKLNCSPNRFDCRLECLRPVEPVQNTADFRDRAGDRCSDAGI